MGKLLIATFGAILLLSNGASAGIRGPGKYTGVVLFDRWDGCYLYGGIYLMPVAEKQKESVRKYAAECVVLDATEVVQLINPGDGRLETFTFAGFPQQREKWDTTDQLKLAASALLDDPKHPAVKLVVTNHGPKPLSLQGDMLAFTVFAKKPADPHLVRWNPADGPSYALETRHSLYGVSLESKVTPKWRNGAGTGNQRVTWSVRGQDPAVKSFDLAPGAKKEFILDLTLTEGEYDIVFGYGSMIPNASKTVASNMVALDASPAGVTEPKVNGR